MAHIGQEVRLQHVGGVGVVARLDQFGHRAAQIVVIDLQPRDQVVEAVGQAVEDVVVRRLLDRLEAAVGGHLAHGLGQALHRFGHAAGQAVGQQNRQAGRAEEQGAGQGQVTGHDVGQAGPARHQGQAAHLARGQHDGADQRVDLGVPGHADLGDDLAAQIGQPYGHDIGGLGHGLEGAIGADGIVIGHRGGGAGRDHLGQNLVIGLGFLAGDAPLLKHEAQACGQQRDHRCGQRDSRDSRLQRRVCRGSGAAAVVDHFPSQENPSGPVSRNLPNASLPRYDAGATKQR